MLVALGRVAKGRFNGPQLESAPKEATPAPRNFPTDVLETGKHTPSQQLGNNLGANASGQRLFGARREIDELSYNKLR